MTGLRALNDNNLHTEMGLRDYNDGPNKDNEMVMELTGMSTWVVRCYP